MSIIAGVDGCKGGWLAVLAAMEASGVLRNMSACVCRDFSTVLDLCSAAEFIVVDMPIGLLDENEQGGRACDREARKLLRPSRTSSVFNPPLRRMLEMSEYSEAQVLGLSKQCWELVPKIREVDTAIAVEGQERIVESHPEVIFATIAGEPMSNKKKTAEGLHERLSLLQSTGSFGQPIAGQFEQTRFALTKRVAADDDIVDAYALLWLAGQKVLGRARTIPANPQRDSKGLRMEMWYV